MKAYMRDLQHNQEPFVVISRTDTAAAQGTLPDRVVPLRPFSSQYVTKLLGLADALEIPEQSLPRAADALRDLVHSNVYELMELPWFSLPRQVDIARVEDLNGPAAFSHLPQMTWPLRLRHGSTVPKRTEEVEVPRQTF